MPMDEPLPSLGSVDWYDWATEIHGDVDDGFARVPMVDPDPPVEGDLRWNPDLDPPATGTASDVYAASKAQLVAGTNVTVVPNDGLETITINSSAPGATGSDPHTWLVATESPYNLSTGGTAAANTTALQACINAAIGAGVNVFIPAGTYAVADSCLTPTLGSAALGLEVWGEGKSRTKLVLEGATTSYFYNNQTSGTTSMFMTFKDIGFYGKLVGTQKHELDTNLNGFRLYGPIDQHIRFVRCYFQSLNGVFFGAGTNNASEIGFTDCKITHIHDYVIKLENLQSLNINFMNTDVEIIWGDVIQANGTGGGAINFTMGSIIIQSHDDGTNVYQGCLVKANAYISGCVTFMGCRIELRSDTRLAVPGDVTLLDGTGGAVHLNFISSTTFITPTSGAFETVRAGSDQFVGFDKCTFEHNGSHMTYDVQGTGWLVFDQCALRTTIQSEITVGASATAKAINCRGRYAQATAIDFSL